MGPREFYEALPSTQDRGIALARSGAEEGTRVVARRQLEGRGRGDRRWFSPEGGLYLSVIFKAPPAHPSLLPLAIGSVLADRLGRRYDVPLRLKWPNDLVVLPEDERPRKLAGIIVDEVASPLLNRASIAGLGINVKNGGPSFPSELAPDAIALVELVSPVPSLDEVEELAVDATLTAARTLAAPSGAAAILEQCRTLLFGIGRSVTLDGVPAGRITALGEEGELLLATPTGSAAIRSGDLRLEEMA
jgi:biotin-[acetyl-CoA-carboxylase] ligase BirA-like protein